jgi:GNAT superfamily N-acetyltransferase
LSSIFGSLLFAAIASLLTYAATRVRRHLNDRRLRRKYPVAGQFITEYEDHAGSRHTTAKAWTALRQKGQEVTGYTRELDSGRTWTLRGRVESGFLNGVYEADDPHDGGVGTFFLKVDGTEGDMEGLWAGYDSVNGKIDGGYYRFRRYPNVAVRPAHITEASQVCALLGDALGELCVDVEAVRETISEKSDATCLVAAGADGQIVGAATFYILNRISFTRFLPLGQGDLPERLRVFRFNESVGLLRSIAVRPAYRGRGTATELTRTGIAWCTEKGATALLAVAWSPPDGCRLAGVMAVTQFEQVTTVANYWTADSKVKDYACPVCGDVCTCSAVIFGRSLDGTRPSRSTTASRSALRRITSHMRHW